MDSLSTDPNDALVFHFNQSCQDKFVGSVCTENRPLDVSSIISSGNTGQETGHLNVEKVEIWVNGVKRVIFVPLGNNPGRPSNPSEPCDSDPNPASPVVADTKTSSCSRNECCSTFSVTTCSSGENTVLSRTVSTNTVDQLPNRCVATVAPQINHKLGRLLVSCAFDGASKSTESGIRQAAAVVKQEKLTSSTDCLNVRPEPAEALALAASIHQRQHLTEVQTGLLNPNECQYQDRQRQLHRPSYDVPGCLPTLHGLTRNAVPHAGLHTYAPESSSTTQFALPNTDLFTGHHRLPTQMPPYLLRPMQTTFLAPSSVVLCGNISDRGESNCGNRFSNVLGTHEPVVGPNEQCSNRSAQILNTPALLSKPAVMVPNLPLQRYQHLLATLDPAKQHSYGRIGAQDGTQLQNVHAPVARFPTRGEYPYPQFPLRLSSNERMVQVPRGDFPHLQFPVRLPSNEQMAQIARGEISHPQFSLRLPTSDHLAQVASFSIGHRFFSHHPSYVSSFAHAENHAGHELCIPSSIASFNAQPSRITQSEMNPLPHSIGIGRAAHTSVYPKQPEAYLGGNLALQRMHQNQSKMSPAVPEMSQMHPLPDSYLHYANLQGCEQVPSPRMLNNTEPSTLHLQNQGSHKLLSTAVAQPLRRSSAGPAHHETAQLSIFPPMNRIVCSNACPTEVPQFVHAPHENVAFSQNAVSCSQTDPLSRCVMAPGLRPADVQNASSSYTIRYPSPSDRAAVSQNLVRPSLMSACPGVPLRSVSQNLSAEYYQKVLSPVAQTTTYLQTLPFSDAFNSQSDVAVQNHEVTGTQSHVPNICNNIQVEDAFRNCRNQCMETRNRIVPALLSSNTSPAVCDPQPSASAVSAVSMALTSTNRAGDKSLDVTLADSNNASASAKATDKEKTLPHCSSDTAVDASQEAVTETTVSPSLKSQLEPGNKFQPTAELQDPQSQAVSLPGSPQSPMSELMNSIDKISDDLSMQKWLDSLIGNISDSSKDGFDCQSKSKTAHLAVVNQTSSKDTTTASAHALVSPPSVAKQGGFKKSKRTWIGIKSIEAEMSPKSSNVKANRRKRRRLTMRSNQSPEGSCDASSDSWHPDSFASSESSMDSVLTSIPSTRASCTESSWSSDDSVTIGKRCKKRSRKSVRSKNQTVHSCHSHTRRLRCLSPWRRNCPRFGKIQGCFVSLEVLCLRGKTSVNVKSASEFLCCSPKTKTCPVQSRSETEDSYGSWCLSRNKKHFLKRDSKPIRNTVRSGSETEDSYSSRQRSKHKNLILKLRYSKPARNVVMSGSDTEDSCGSQQKFKTVRHFPKSKNSKPARNMVKSGSEDSCCSWQPSRNKKRFLRLQI